MLSTYRYYINIFIFCCVASLLCGQTVKSEINDSIITTNNTISKDDSIKTKKPFFNSFRIDLDVSPVITTFINNGEIYSYEAAIQTEIINKYYPIFEIGYAGAKTLTSSGINYNGNALFYRLGMDFNIVKSKIAKKTNNNFFLVGARLGYTNFDYNINSIQIQDDYWGGSSTFEKTKKSSNLWFEIAAGIRVELIKNIYIGWNVRIKNMLTKEDLGEYKPWYVPGYGVYGDSSVWGFNYLIGYKFKKL